MQHSIHPSYTDTQFVCNCGHQLTVRSTVKETTVQLDVCSKCHPFFTGQQKLIDTAGKADLFRQRYGDSNAS